MTLRFKILPGHSADEPGVLRVIGEESARNGTDALTTDEIDRIIKASRARKMNH
jgi:hypothetical protein